MALLDEAKFDDQISQTERRYRRNEVQRGERIQLLRENKPFKADSPERVRRWFERRGYAGVVAEDAIRTGAMPAEFKETFAPPAVVVGLERVLGTSDFLGVAFLDRGLQVSRTVARVSVNVKTGSPRTRALVPLAAPYAWEGQAPVRWIAGSAGRTGGTLGEADVHWIC